MYVLVSQGIEIYRTENKQEALEIMNRENADFWHKLLISTRRKGEIVRLCLL